MRVLSDLWYGNIAPNERTKPRNGEYRKLLQTLSNLREQIRTTLSPEYRQLLDEYEGIYTTINAQSEEDAFIIGFRLGAKIMLEVLERNPSA